MSPFVNLTFAKLDIYESKRNNRLKEYLKKKGL